MATNVPIPKFSVRKKTIFVNFRTQKKKYLFHLNTSGKYSNLDEYGQSVDKKYLQFSVICIHNT